VYESDHIHNLPALIRDYAPQLLEFYWNTERPLLIKQISADECRAFWPHWERLAKLIPQAGVAAVPNEFSAADPAAVIKG